MNVSLSQVSGSPRGRSPRSSAYSPSEPIVQNEKSTATLSSIGSEKCFTFLLANNTSNQFGVCLLLPRIFKDLSRGVVVHCDYCVCILTKLPFLSFFFNLLLQFDAQGGLDFSEPVKRFSIGIENFKSFQPSFQPPPLRLLIEFTRHLRDIKVSLYRFGTKDQSMVGSFDEADSSLCGVDEMKSSYQPISFSMALRTGTPRGSFSQLLDAMNAGPSFTTSTSQFVSGTQAKFSNTRGLMTKRFLYGMFRRDLMGVYSALPLFASNSDKTIPTGLSQEPPYLPTPR